MELDNLRRQWQQPEPTGISVAELAKLLRQSSASIMGQMRRNTWNEIVVAGLVVVSSLGQLLLHKGPVSLLYAALLGLLVVIMTGYYVLQMALLKQLARTDTDVRGHLGEVCASLRRLLNFNDKLTLWTGPVTWLVLLGYYCGHEMSRPAGPHWQKLLLVLGSSLVVGVGLQFGLMRLNRWWSQHRYGQHLDRLEGQLRELDENAPADTKLGS